MPRLVLALFLPLLLGACAAPRAPARPVLDGAAAARAVALCGTTLADLQARLGAPTRDGLLGRDRIVSWITVWDPLPKYLAVLVDERSVVTDLYWDLPTEIPWTPRDRCRPAA